MATAITIHMYSGFPNPDFELAPEEEKIIAKVFYSHTERTPLNSPSSIGILGYRGFEISSSREDTFFTRL